MAGESFFSVSTDVREALNFFDGLDVNKVQIRRRILISVGNGARQAAKRGVGNTLLMRTGKLARHMQRRIDSQAMNVYVFSDAESGKNTSKKGQAARYGFMLAKGYTIRDQNVETLTFNIDGKWIRKHEVTVPPKDWLAPSVERYVRSGESSVAAEKALQRQIDYWEKRITGKVTRI